ncbi:MAG: hypothetical protein MUF69_10360 [Desulfobacterota bacterium]|jgi:hypothetical protein|nr:hypothetical protein [Thermodesulfobacteriota bacterium]
MEHGKFSFREKQAQFISRYRSYGFKDKSALVRAALDRLEEELEKENLRKSASLYAEIYPDDAELKEVTAVALTGWPE